MNSLMTKASAKLFVLLVLTTAAVTAAAAERYYRYVNDDGVTVMDSRVPPEYVKNGYEVVTVSGRVVEVVPPAPSPEEAEALSAQRQREAELAEGDRYLLRRYSSVADIKAAKQRKLADFEASVSILRGNMNGIEAQIESVQARAANIERSGREVPDVLLENLKNLQAELAKEKRQFELRVAAKEALEERFDREIERFAEIKPSS